MYIVGQKKIQKKKERERENVQYIITKLFRKKIESPVYRKLYLLSGFVEKIGLGGHLHTEIGPNSEISNSNIQF